jgi:phosphohistidine swiveling domain-containing protein/glycerol-3-phosphate acyltransferase PlsY
MLTLTQVWGAVLIFVCCPLIGAAPLTLWLVRFLSGKNLAHLGTGNVGVSAAFYHGGTVAGVASVLAEAGKGIAAVLLAQHYFPLDPTWQVVALIALVMGRYWVAKGAGTTNVIWGFVVYDPITVALGLGLSFLGFTLVRQKRQGRTLALILAAVITALRHSQDGTRILAVVCLCTLLGWIYQKMPDDLDMPATEARVESQRLFGFFQGDRALLSLEKPLPETKAGGKAAALSQLKAWGYPVPRGYVLAAGDDPTALIAITQPSPQQPVIVRSSAIGEDGVEASAAGQYLSFGNLTSQEELAAAITRCLNSYNAPAAVQYRRDRNLPDGTMAVLVQQQIPGVYSGVAFSRDPIARTGDAVVIEALPGGADAVVSGQRTPESYQVIIQPDDLPDDLTDPDSWLQPQALDLAVEGNGSAPSRLIQQVAFLARHLEARYQGLPQDVEWTFDGQQLWLLQSRPITTLYPLWTRKIAAEVIPGVIRPLTWSINRPLTCGVWGEIFTLVLGGRAKGLDFETTATLHHGRAYFNASLLGDIFLRMGLPPESLEFLTRGAKFSKPPWQTTVRNLPGLWRLLQRELRLVKDFAGDRRRHFEPLLQALAAKPVAELTAPEHLSRIEQILVGLRRATYYSILAPLSLALRQGILSVPDTALDASQNPEVASLKALQSLAEQTRLLLPQRSLDHIDNAASLFADLAENPDGASVLGQLDDFLARYGYLSDVATDISIPTWQENPHPVRELFAQLVLAPSPKSVPSESTAAPANWQQKQVQARLDLKGQVNETYSRLLAELRWTMVALEQRAIVEGWLQEPGDIFFLSYGELQDLIQGNAGQIAGGLSDAIAARRYQFEQDEALKGVPYLVYGNDPPNLAQYAPTTSTTGQVLQGIAASPGQREGTVKVLTQGQTTAEINATTILVVPYTDAGWAAVLARAGGLIAEVGGRLSHGAIVAREYGIPAVMDVTDATQRFQDGQRVRIDGERGTVELL